MEQKTILMVCTGNTCRSAMAEALMRDILAKQHKNGGNIQSASKNMPEFKIISAGISAIDGLPAAREAIWVMKDEGIDLTPHCSSQLNNKLINKADIIYTMTDNHKKGILEVYPKAKDKILNLNPDGDIADPVGGSKEVYEKTAKTLRKLLKYRLKELQTT